MKRIFALLLALLVLAGCGAAAVDWQEQYDLGIRYLSEQNYSEAILAFTAAIEVDPNRQELYIGRAQAYVASGETEENLAAALADYEKAKELGYTDADLWLGLADIYIRQGDYDKALKILKEGLEATSGNSDIQAKIDELESGTVTDIEGKIRRISGYDADNVLTWYITYQYDAKGRMASAISYDSSGTQIEQLDAVYDENGWCIQEISYNSADGRLIRMENTYDSTGTPIRSRSVGVDGMFYSDVETTTDEAGNMISKHYDSDGNLLNTSTWEYDPVTGKATRIIVQNALGEITKIQENSYNEAGLLEKVSLLDQNGDVFCYTIYEYDENGRQIRKTEYDANGAVKYSVDLAG